MPITMPNIQKQFHRYPCMGCSLKATQNWHCKHTATSSPGFCISGQTPWFHSKKCLIDQQTEVEKLHMTLMKYFVGSGDSVHRHQDTSLKNQHSETQKLNVCSQMKPSVLSQLSEKDFLTWVNNASEKSTGSWEESLLTQWTLLHYGFPISEDFILTPSGTEHSQWKTFFLTYTILLNGYRECKHITFL